jgi:hypothetical protein
MGWENLAVEAGGAMQILQLLLPSESTRNARLTCRQWLLQPVTVTVRLPNDVWRSGKLEGYKKCLGRTRPASHLNIYVKGGCKWFPTDLDALLVDPRCSGITVHLDLDAGFVLELLQRVPQLQNPGSGLWLNGAYTDFSPSLRATVSDLKCSKFGITLAERWGEGDATDFDLELLQCLRGLQQLRTLRIGNLRVSVDTLHPSDRGTDCMLLRSSVAREVGLFHWLTRLSLPGISTTSSRPEVKLALPFTGMTALHRLDLSVRGWSREFRPDTPFTNFDLRDLPPSLRSLNLSGTDCDIGGIGDIPALSGLHELFLSQMPSGRKELPLEDLVKLRGLRVLSLWGSRNVPVDRSPLYQLAPQLDMLNLNDTGPRRTELEDTADAVAFCAHGLRQQHTRIDGPLLILLPIFERV